MTNMMQSLYTTQDAMRVNQAGMSVVSNNIANMNTVGYSKQRLDTESVTFKAGSIAQLVQMQPGTVAIERVTRYQDEFLNSFIMQENSAFGYYSKSSEVLNSLDEYFNEIQGTGLTGALKDYFSATQQLTTDPMNKVVRANFISQASSVATAFNTKYTQLTDYRASLVGDGATANALDNSQMGQLINDINSKVEQITELNRQIAVFTTQQGTQPNSLLDKRQVLLEEIAMKAPITTRAEGSSLNLYIGNIQLVSDGKQLAQFDVIPNGVNNPALVSVVDIESGSPLIADYKTAFSQDQGELKALLDAGGNGVDSVFDILGELNTLAQNFAINVNNIQLRQTFVGPLVTESTLKIDTATNTLTPATENIFLDGDNPAPYNPATITAGNIIVNQIVKDNPFEIATAFGAVDVLPGPVIVAHNPNAVGNNNNAMDFATMRDKAILALGGLTVEKNYYSTVSSIGNNTALAKDKLDAQKASLDQLNDKKQSMVGVNLDEELVDLMKYQKAYEASAQVFSVINQMLSVIMNMGR